MLFKPDWPVAGGVITYVSAISFHGSELQASKSFKHHRCIINMSCHSPLFELMNLFSSSFFRGRPLPVRRNICDIVSRLSRRTCSITTSIP